MTKAESLIIKYINQNFAAGSIQIRLKGLDAVTIVDTKKKIAVSNISHTLNDVMRNPYELPINWTNLPQQGKEHE